MIFFIHQIIETIKTHSNYEISMFLLCFLSSIWEDKVNLEKFGDEYMTNTRKK